MLRKLVIHQPNFLPYLGFFEQLNQADVYIAYDDVQFTQNEFQNRNSIKSPNGKTNLTLPVIKKGRLGQLINEVELVDQDWATIIKNRLRGFYLKAPFYEEVIDAFESVFSSHVTKMVDVNLPLIKVILLRLGIRPDMRVSSTLNIVYEDRVDRIFKLMEEVEANVLIVGAGAATYLNADDFEKKGYQLRIQSHEPKEYPQLHGDFVPYLSIVDYLMNVGFKYWGDLNGAN